MKSLSGSLTWIASEKLLRPRAKFCFSSPCCRNWWAAVLSQPSGANPYCLMSCFNFQWETKYQKVHILCSLFFLSLFSSTVFPSELHSQVLVKWIWEFSLLSCARHPVPTSNTGPQASLGSVGLAWPLNDLCSSELDHKTHGTSMNNRQRSTDSAEGHGEWTECCEITPVCHLVPMPSHCGPQGLSWTTFKSLRKKNQTLSVYNSLKLCPITNTSWICKHSTKLSRVSL